MSQSFSLYFLFWRNLRMNSFPELPELFLEKFWKHLKDFGRRLKALTEKQSFINLRSSRFLLLYLIAQVLTPPLSVWSNWNEKFEIFVQLYRKKHYLIFIQTTFFSQFTAKISNGNLIFFYFCDWINNFNKILLFFLFNFFFRYMIFFQPLDRCGCFCVADGGKNADTFLIND